MPASPWRGRRPDASGPDRYGRHQQSAGGGAEDQKEWPCGRTKTLNASFRNANTLGIRRAGSRLARKDQANGRNSRRTCSGRQRSSVRPGPADPLVPVEGWPAVRAGGAAALACEGTRGFQRPAPMRKWLPGSHRSARRGRPASIRAPGAHVECCRGASVPSCYRSIIDARPPAGKDVQGAIQIPRCCEFL